MDADGALEKKLVASIEGKKLGAEAIRIDQGNRGPGVIMGATDSHAVAGFQP